MIDIDSNIKRVSDSLRNVARQVPFATAKALNQTARDVQQAEGENLQQRLTVRTDWWKPGRALGINIRFASKSNLEATVGSRAPWLQFQESGGTKVPTKKALAVAVVGGARPSFTSPIPRRNMPRRLRETFVKASPSGSLSIFQRVGQGIRRMFGLIPSARIKAVLGYRETGEVVIERVYEGNFDRAYEEAIKSAK